MMARSGAIQWPQRVVSGGQTGVDRGALDAAIAAGIAHGGWCPQGRLAEDGPIPQQYQLRETRSRKYSIRTRRNVLDADATLILSWGPLSGGTELTYRLAQHHARPCLVVDLQQVHEAASVRAWLATHRVGTLNVAGPRESAHRGIAERACRFLLQVFAEHSTIAIEPESRPE
ncbi:MAG: putative molybdenum carrier protein [Pirellulaceae bacterium]